MLSRYAIVRAVNEFFGGRNTISKDDAIALSVEISALSLEATTSEIFTRLRSVLPELHGHIDTSLYRDPSERAVKNAFSDEV
jgi:hypothetical protein